MSNGFPITENPFFKHDIDKLCLICNHQFKMDQTTHSILDRLEQTRPEPQMNVYDALESISKFKEIKLQRKAEKVCEFCFNDISRVIRFCEMCNKSASFLKSYIQYQEMNHIPQSDITNSVTHGDGPTLTELTGANVLGIKSELLNDHEEQDMKMQVWPEFVSISTVDTLGSTDGKDKTIIQQKVITNIETCVEELCTNEKMLYDEMEPDVKMEIWPELPTITTSDKLNCTAAMLVKEETIIQDISNVPEGITHIETSLDRPTLTTTATLINADTAIGLKNHEEIIVNGSRRVKCVICDRFYRKDYIKIHMRIHTDEKPFCCKICDKAFRSSAGLLAHNQAHIDLHDLPCIICGKSQAEKNSSEGPNECKYEPHECKYDPLECKPFVCEKCGKCFSSKKQLKEHIIIHLEAKRHECNVCGKIFLTSRYLTTHLVSVHSNEKTFACQNCGKRFSTSKRLKEHLIIHLEVKRHECKVCGRKFSHPRKLKEHLNVHSDEKPFICDKCGKCLPSRKRLRGHMNIHLEMKTHECNVCGKNFLRSSDLKEHLSVHSDEKPFACEECGKCFSTRKRLKGHMIIHMEVKKHECKVCGKTFPRPSKLKDHLTVHSDENH